MISIQDYSIILKENTFHFKACYAKCLKMMAGKYSARKKPLRDFSLWLGGGLHCLPVIHRLLFSTIARKNLDDSRRIKLCRNFNSKIERINIRSSLVVGKNPIWRPARAKYWAFFSFGSMVANLNLLLLEKNVTGKHVEQFFLFSKSLTNPS